MSSGGETKLALPWRWAWVLLPVLPMVVAGVFVWVQRSDESPELVDVASSGLKFTQLEELAAASDLVVAGSIVGVEPGRVVSDPSDPTAGISTTLFSFEPEQVLAGGLVDEPLIVEHETGLADGSPITIDGVAPPREGEQMVLFLVAGVTEQFPHFAIVNSQGRYLLSGTKLGPLIDNPLAESVAELTLAELAETLAAN